MAVPSVAVGLAVLAALASLVGVVQPGRWVALSTFAVAVVLATSSWRRPRSGRLATTLTAALAGVVLTGAVAFRPLLDAEGSLGARLAALARDGALSITDGQAPISASPGLELGIVLGAVLLTVLVDAIALGLGQPGIGALALAGVWSVTLVFERPPSTPLVLAGATTLVLLLWAARPWGLGTPPPSHAPGAVAVAAAVAVLALLLTPLASSAPGWASTTLGARWGSAPSGGLLSLSTDLDLRSDLGDRPDRTVLTYRTEMAEVGPLRTSTLVRFDGRRWSPSPSGALLPTTSVLWPEPTTVVPIEQVDVQITELDQTTLPIPLDPRTVDAESTWDYDPANDVVVSRGGRSAGVSYTLRVAARDLSPAILRADRPHATEPGAAETELVGSHADQIGELAQTVVGDAGNAYDEAVALQSWFRDVRQFTYSPDVAPAQSDDAVWDFLQDRRGYCVQFATAMTLMARSLGIPARVGVGFLPGERGTDGIWRVSARRAHAWPELWFADSGWVRFEPTPAEQTDSVPAYADPDAGAAATQEPDVPTAGASTGPSGSPTPRASAPPVTASGSTGGGSFVPLAVAGIGLAFAGLAAAVVRQRRPPLTPERAWSRVRSAAAGRVTWSDATTPRQAAVLLRAHLKRRGGGSAEADEAAGAVQMLARLVEAERYAPHPRAWTADELDRLTALVLAELSADRAASPSAPRSA